MRGLTFFSFLVLSFLCLCEVILLLPYHRCGINPKKIERIAPCSIESLWQGKKRNSGCWNSDLSPSFPWLVGRSLLTPNPPRNADFNAIVEAMDFHWGIPSPRHAVWAWHEKLIKVAEKIELYFPVSSSISSIFQCLRSGQIRILPFGSLGGEIPLLLIDDHSRHAAEWPLWYFICQHVLCSLVLGPLGRLPSNQY